VPFEVIGSDNGAHMFEHEGVGQRCQRCGYLLARDVVDPEFSLSSRPDEWIEDEDGMCYPAKKNSKRRYDLSYTYDGRPIASANVRSLVERLGTTTVEFVPIPKESRFFLVRAVEVVELDTEASQARFDNRCPTCGQWESIVAPATVLVDPGAVDDLGLYRTDVELGSGDEKSPVLVVGDGLAAALRPLRGVTLREAR
jgi:hypothetical protein